MSAQIQETEDSNTIWVSIGLTKNIGNYESLRIDCGARVTLHEGDSRDDTWAKLWDEVDTQLESKVLEVSQGAE